MPIYTYRREDGTTFDLRQNFTDDALTVDPATGQRVVRIIHAAGIVFKGSGFYVNDSKNASRSTVNNTSSTKESKDAKESKDSGGSTDSKESKDSAPAKEKTEKPAPAPVKSEASAAAD